MKTSAPSQEFWARSSEAPESQTLPPQQWGTGVASPHIVGQTKAAQAQAEV